MTTSKILFLIFAGFALFVAGCGANLNSLRSSWNAANDAADDMLAHVETRHEAAMVAATTEAERDAVIEKYAPIYQAFRVFRALLASAKAALEAAELKDDPDLADLAGLVADLLNAQKTVHGAIQ
jgi:hypothetical protein